MQYNELQIKRFNDIHSLHKYFLNVVEVKELFDKLIVNKNQYKNEIFEIKFFIIASLYYSTLYVVVEGWQKLKLNDAKIDELLKNKNTKLLNRYRDGTFHYHKDYYDKKFIDFYAEESTVKWIQALYNEFSCYFKNFYNNIQY